MKAVWTHYNLNVQNSMQFMDKIVEMEAVQQGFHASILHTILSL